MNALRLLIGAETYPPDVNGAARFAGRLAAGLAARGHEVHVVAPSPTGPPGRTVRDGLTVHHVSSKRYRPLDAMRICMPWDAARETARIMRDVDPDVVHTNGHLVVGRGVVHAARRTGRRLVATNHLMPENLVGYLPLPGFARDAVGGWMWRDLGRVYSHAQAVTAPTPRAVELLTERSGITAAVPVSNGIDTERFRPRPHAPAVEPTILFVGRLDPEKRVDELLRAVAALPTVVRCRVEVVGDGPRRAGWTALATGLGIADRVRFRGLVTDDELLECYARADLFCMPSVAELQSLVTLEAMAAGLPVVAADAMALPHLVRPGVNGRLYRPGDTAELSGHLADLLRDHELRGRSGAASRRIVAEHALEATLVAYEDLYARVLDRGLVTMDGPAAPTYHRRSTRRSLPHEDADDARDGRRSPHDDHARTTGAPGPGVLNDLLQAVLDAIQAVDPALRTAVAGLAMMLETSALIGLVIPGDAVVLAAATGVTSVSAGVLLTTTVLVGALVGESIGFGLGRRFGPTLQTSRLGRLLGDEHWERARRYLQRRGGPAIFLSRFIPVLHSTVPMIAGTVGVPYRAFLAWTAPACLLWSATYVTAGSVAAGVFRDLASDLKGAGYVLAGIVAVLGLAVLGIKTLVVRNERPYYESSAEDADPADPELRPRAAEHVAAQR